MGADEEECLVNLRGISPSVREGSDVPLNEPSLTVGLVPPPVQEES